jgi:DNA repair protein RecO (recombination protein O)
MHHIYHTNSLILSSRNRGEANRMLTLLTREMGLVHAAAQGIRLNKSKLRYALSDYAYAKVDLVRGKELWRVTSATPVESFSTIRRTPNGIKLLASISKLLRRLVQGEAEFHESVFDDTLAAYRFLETGTPDAHTFEVVELVLVLRILKKLGYISDNKFADEYTQDAFDPLTIDYARFEKKTILFEINRALHESHL